MYDFQEVRTHLVIGWQVWVKRNRLAYDNFVHTRLPTGCKHAVNITFEGLPLKIVQVPFRDADDRVTKDTILAIKCAEPGDRNASLTTYEFFDAVRDQELLKQCWAVVCEARGYPSDAHYEPPLIFALCENHEVDLL